MRARLLVVFAALLLPVVVAAPTSAGSRGGPCSGFSKGTDIAMLDSCFQGVAHFVPARSTITVTNQGQTTHNLTSFEGGFTSPALQPGERYRFEVDRPGVYEYFCTLHGSSTGAGMAGVLVVEDEASLAVARIDAGKLATAGSMATTTTASQPGSAWGWVALGALLLAGAALCVSLALIRPRQT
jgi:plastocyanin